MGGSPQLDDSLMDSLKNFDLNSPEVKQQFGRSNRSFLLLYILLDYYSLVGIYYGIISFIYRWNADDVYDFLWLMQSYSVSLKNMNRHFVVLLK